MNIKTLCVGPIGTNCYLLCDKAAGACAVIDPGGDAPAVAAAVKESGCAPQAILLTHAHYDHTGAVAELRDLWPGVPVYLNRRDAYEGDPYLAQLFPPVPGAENYDEGDTLTLGGLTVSVLATPGHSEGSVTLRCGDALFCGDMEAQAELDLVKSGANLTADLLKVAHHGSASSSSPRLSRSGRRSETSAPSFISSSR